MACVDKHKNSTNSLTLQVQVANYAIENPFLYSHYVILQTPDSVIMGEIKKMQIIGDKIYITDNQHESIFCFDFRGNYLNRLNRQGRSNKEYIRIEDFEVNSDGSICIFDGELKKIILYDSEGNFMESMPAINGIAFKILSNGLIAYNRGNGAASINNDADQLLYNYACAKGKEIEINAVPFDKVLEGRRFFLGQAKNCFFEWDREIFMSSMLNNTIFKISKHNGHIEPYAVFDIENERRAKSSGQAVLHFAEDVMNGNSASNPYNFQKYRGLLMIMYNCNLQPHTFIYDEETDKQINGIISFDKYGLPFLPISYMDSDNLGKVITLLEPYNIPLFLDLAKKKGLDSSILEELQLKSNINDNTILIFNNWPESL
jgi:hypothetical protein